MGTFKMAAVNAAPVWFDRDASTIKACSLIEEAGQRGASIAAFGETWLPGFPIFMFGSDLTDDEHFKKLAHYYDQAVEIPSATTDKLCEAAKAANIDVVIGVVERDARTQGTVYCSLLFIGSSGEILGVHRKLKPTFTERTVWGEGDGSGLRTYQRDYGRISGLNCWEHNMMLPGYVLMNEGTQIHVAAWPGLDIVLPAPASYNPRSMLLSRAFASQAACYVINVGAVLNDENVPLGGESCIIDPRGEILEGPVHGEQILIVEGSDEAILAAKAAFDITGHYSRPDIFQVHVNRTPAQRVYVTEENHQADHRPLGVSDEVDSKQVPAISK